MKRGFTLIELLAVILILGIIALIAIPTVSKLVEDAKKGAFKTSAETILKVTEEKYFSNVLKNNQIKTLYNLEDNELEYKGDKSIVGQSGIVNEKGVIAVHNDKFCAKKNAEDKEIEITDYHGFCELDPEVFVKNVDESCFSFESGTITGYNSNCGDSIRIPETIGGVTVTRIGNGAFQSEKVTVCYDAPSHAYTFPNNSKSKLNEYYPSGCYDDQNGGLLRYVEFPNTITYIGDDAFYENRLEKLSLPDSITSMGKWVFAENQIRSLKLPNNIQSMGTCIFERNFLKEVEVPGSLKIIPTYAFGNNYLEKITLNEGIEQIKSSAFWNQNIEEYTIPSSVKRLENRALAWGKTHKVIIKGKNSKSDFDYYYSEPNSIFGWDEGYDDSNIIYEGK